MITNFKKLVPWSIRRAARRVMARPRRAVQAWRYAMNVASSHQLSTFRILQEQLLLRKFHSINRYSYYQYRLFNPELSFEEKKQYLQDDKEGNTQLWTLLTPDKYRCLYDNKLVFSRFFGSLGFPVATVFGVYDPVVGHTTDGQCLRDAADLSAWLRTSGVQEFVFKPLEGIQGHQILVFVGRAADDPDKLVTLGGDVYDVERLIAFTEDAAALEASNPGANTHSFLIEERIQQHPEVVALIGHTLCCVRVQTIVARDGMPQIVAAVFKLQPNPVGVDHLVHGAVAAWVDLDSGVLGKGRTRSDLAYTSMIPGTDTTFVGFQLPYWVEVKELALRAAAAFPWARGIGWDIAISEQGPVLIEGNERWSPSLIQLPAPHGLMTGEFKALCEALGRRQGRVGGKGADE